MTSLTDVFVTVKPDMDKFGPEVKRKLARIDAKKEGKQVATRFGVGMNGAMGGIVSRSAGIFAAGFALIKGAQIFTGFINDARESAKVARISAQVIKSTGGVAKITAGQMGALATAISNATGADDEAIQAGENLLATFTNVRNETGKGNKIFDRATQAAVDMAAAMNNGVVDANGLKSANIQLGKALNDPIKGVTALTKVGVSFTKQQKDQIKSLVESGDVLGAQKVILAEVGKEFGGAAAAATDPLTKLHTIVGNVSETIGGAFLPIVDKAATWLGENLPGAVATAGKFFNEKLLPPLTAVKSFFTDQVIPAVGDTVDAFTGLGKKLVSAIGPIDLSGIATEIFNDTKAWAGSIIGGLKSGVESGDWKPLGKALGDGAIAAVQNASDLGEKLGTAFKTLINKVDWKKVGNDSTAAIINFISGINWAQVGKALSLAVLGSLKINKEVYDAVIKGATDLALGMGKAITDAMARWRVNVVAYVKQVGGDLVSGLWAGIRGAMKGVGNFIKSVVVDPIVNWTKSLFGVHSPSTVFAGIGAQLVAGLKAGVSGAIRGIGRWLGSVVVAPVIQRFTMAGTWLLQAGKNVIDGFGRGMRAIWPKVTGWVGGIATWIKDHKGPVSLDGRLLIPAGRAIMAGFLKGLQSGAGPAWNFVTKVGGKTKEAVAAAAGWIKGFGWPSANLPADVAAGVLGGPNRRVFYQGEAFDLSTYQKLVKAMRLVGGVNVTQGGYEHASSYSGTTHTGGGVFDVVGGNLTRILAALKSSGLIGWIRNPNQGNWPWHIHALDPSDTGRMSASARGQVADYYRGGDGLGGYKLGTPWVPNDQLAFLHRGEAVVPADVNRARASGPGIVELGPNSIKALARELSRISVTASVDARSFDQGISREAMRRGL